MWLRRLNRLARCSAAEDAIIVDGDHVDDSVKGLEPGGNAGESPRMDKKRFHAALFATFLIAGTSAAQSGVPMRGPDYFRDASDLAETLGSAHAIRVRCNGRNDQYWRRYMADMLGYEAPDKGNLRSSLVERFNNAYSRVSAQYLQCDNRAVEAEARFASTGKDISIRMATHYFPKDSRRRRGTDR